ncbi:hypothetical protein SY83_10140 [Paenibacillus swuensis]|uniref:Uncharacterized protein n=1 Tax=Paenibacillus swuensis TaxID=1178515 RepID=A0A172TIF8_9BACL|nr:hypothetical protein [Paenibacillus swuensis]ANE46573.1 hypothetical protein SY83_10140 [Paenibacillus swuensis]
MSEHLYSRFRRVEQLWIGGLFGFSALFILGLIIGKWPRYWAYIASEMTPMTWWESVVLFTCFTVTLLCAALTYIAKGWGRGTVVYAILSGAFLFLTLDERFALHERIRDGYLAPQNIKPLPWVGAGDFLVMLYAALGLLFLRYVWRELQLRRGAQKWLLAGIVLSIAAVGADSFDVSRMTLDAERLEQTIEEILETGAMLCFLAAFSLAASAIGQKLIIMKLAEFKQ